MDSLVIDQFRSIYLIVTCCHHLAGACKKVIRPKNYFSIGDCALYDFPILNSNGLDSAKILVGCGRSTPRLSDALLYNLYLIPGRTSLFCEQRFYGPLIVDRC